MCNLSLIFSKKEKISHIEDVAFRYMIVNNSVVNNDGTGFFFPFSGKIFYEKFVEEGSHIIPLVAFAGLPWAVAHVRKTSRGKKCYDHTHPIVYDDVFVAHNGTMTLKNSAIKDSSVYSDTEEFTIKLAEKLAECQGDIFSALNLAFSIFEHGTYAMFIYYGERLYFLAQRNTVFLAETENSILANTSKENLVSSLYLLNIAYEKTVTPPKKVEQGVYEITREGFKKISDEIFLEEKKTPPAYIFAGGTKSLSRYVEGLTTSDIKKIMSQLTGYSKETLYKMLLWNPNTFLYMIERYLE